MRSKLIVVIILALALAGIVILRQGAQKKPRPVTAAKKRAVEVAHAPKVKERARVAIVMDDFGYNINYLDEIFSIGEPITFSILPELAYSKEVAYAARERGYETILHLPLEAHGKNVKEEADTIRHGMSKAQVEEKLSAEISSVPGATGVSNHMGSKATEDKGLMAVIFNCLKKKHLYFFDSLTSEESVCRETAKNAGIKYARRDVFLDNSNEPEYIARQLDMLEKLALERGRAIAVCHDRKNTIAALAKRMPRMAGKGIKFVYLKEMVR